jgi:hypothetical protein
MIARLIDMGILCGIKVVGCDSTNANTGYKGGVIQNIEKAVGHPLQWFICLLHTNELPLRHLFQTLEGPTTGPTSSSGGIWKAIQSCESLPIAPFQPIADGEGLPDFSTTIQQSEQRPTVLVQNYSSC